MIKRTANYANTNSNFVIQNLQGKRVETEYLGAICILKNILQRGSPTLMSSYLQGNLGELHKTVDFHLPTALISNRSVSWSRIIRGDEHNDYYPAQKFIEELIPRYLDEFSFIQQLIIPEVPINDITQVKVDKYEEQQVDFYLPQAYLVIEIDGEQHSGKEKADATRDEHFGNYGIEVIRIKTHDLVQENSSFLAAVDAIKKRIERIIASELKRRDNGDYRIGLIDYQSSYLEPISTDKSELIATAIIRFQILILELLERRELRFEEDWNIEVLCHDTIGFSKLAIEDLFVWFRCLLQLQKTPFTEPTIDLQEIDAESGFSRTDSLKVDFSLLQRYTDEFQTNEGVIFVRTDYFDRYLAFKKGDSNQGLKFSHFESYDYFQISTSNLIKYDLTFGGENSDEKPLLYLLWNLFLQNYSDLSIETLKFREGQLPIIANILSRNDTIGLLPTGSGKSVCYQMAAILQPAISFVVCPIKALMYDQKADLDNVYFTRTNHITGDFDAAEKARIQREFGRGKYFFIFISPERFQIKTFREYFRSVNSNFKIAYAVIDEVHCLSEWGHDFRTSYLNLSATIQRFCSDFNFLGLTATASLKVLTDLKIEFGIKQENVKTPMVYTREELEFNVIDDQGDKVTEVVNLLHKIDQNEKVLELKGKETKCGIIFTPTVNGRSGCYPLSQRLSNVLNAKVNYYSGSIPRIDGHEIMKSNEFDLYKNRIQDGFKKNEFSLLTATKAFGMGVNKGNIHYTIHYGIPGSMESLYQEAGRAGRDKPRFKAKKAQCYVLLSKSHDKQILDQVFKPKITLTELQELSKKIKGDVNSNLFLFLVGQDSIKKEFEIISKLYRTYARPKASGIIVRGSSIKSKKAQTEKAIYRLSQLGIVKDWTIESFFGGGEFEVEFFEFNEKKIKEALIATIRKYEANFNIDSLPKEDKYDAYRKILNEAPAHYTKVDKMILILLQWTYDNFTDSRRQSLKNIYENCRDLADEPSKKDEFKQRIENYFKISEATYVLQHVAENPMDHSKWFEVFCQIEENKLTNSFITERQQESLRDNLSRFLESYMNNTGLDLISGLLRLMLNDFENADGANRLRSSLNYVKSLENDAKKYILGEILWVGTHLKNSSKAILAKELSYYFESINELKTIYEALPNEHILNIIIGNYSGRLEDINNKLYGELKEVR
jgi:ATP-dependent DNA helicase RecQ